MAQPPSYNRTKDFTEDFGQETDHAALNAELDKASNSINDIRRNLAVLQADDGKLRPFVVTPDSISPELRASLVDGVVTDAQAMLDRSQAAADASVASAEKAKASEIAAETSEREAADSAVQAAQSAQEALAAVNADWNATGGPAAILNKPDLSLKADKQAVDVALSAKADKSQLSAYLPLTGGTMSGNLAFGNGSVSLSRGNYEVTDFDLGLRRSPYQRFTFINNEADNDFGHVSVIYAGYDANNHARYALTRRGEIVSEVTFEGKYLGRRRIPSIVEKGGTVNWYRKWSDGWLEQGGYFSASDSLQSIVFPLPYRNGDYTLTIGTVRSSVNTPNIVIQDKLASFFNIFSTDNTNGNWHACGWGV